MNYNDKEFSNYSGFIKIAKMKKTANFIEFVKLLLKIIIYKSICVFFWIRLRNRHMTLF